MNPFKFIANVLDTADAVVTKSSTVVLGTLTMAENYTEVGIQASEHTLLTYKLENSAELKKLQSDLDELIKL
jgi:small nuclear ribonucleoprotein (snRNP)-like protein